jgi:hypothetical protein
VLRSATYCESCREVCTPDDRREHLLDRYHQAPYARSLVRH